MPRRRFWFCCLGLVLLGLAVHWPGGIGFKSDDYPAIAYAGDFSRVLHDFVGRQYDLRFLVLYRPLITFSLWVDYQLFGIEPFGYLLLNVLAFLGSVLVLACCLRLLAGEARGSLLGLLLGLLWILHPVLPVSLQWVVGRVDTHVGLLILLACFFHLRARRGAAAWPLWLCTVLALMSKESAFGLPLLLLGLDFLDERGEGRGLSILGRRLQALPLLSLLPLVLLWRLWVLGTVVGGYSFQAAAGFAPIPILRGLWDLVCASVTTGDAFGGLARILAFLWLGVSLVLFLFAGRRLRWNRLLGLLVLAAGLYGPLAQALPSMIGVQAPRLGYLAVLLPLAGMLSLLLMLWGVRNGWWFGLLAMALLALLPFQLARQMDELAGHDRFNRSLVASSRAVASALPAGVPVVLAGDAERANHPQRFLWGLGSLLKLPFHSAAREVVSLRKLHEHALAVSIDQLGLPCFVRVSEEGCQVVSLDEGDLPLEVEPFGFDGRMSKGLMKTVSESPETVGYEVGEGWDGRVQVLSSLGSCTLKLGQPGQRRFTLLQVLGANVTWQHSASPLPAYLLLWNAGDLSRSSPMYLCWRERKGLRMARLWFEESFLQEIYEGAK
ncbi:MAG: hypothetical protein CSA62_11905 [Planctomycetota bacterium]|nr:MAG: hypothetical protein CSA62_11905 [Planctomycetota bacterium]